MRRRRARTSRPWTRGASRVLRSSTPRPAPRAASSTASRRLSASAAPSTATSTSPVLPHARPHQGPRAAQRQPGAGCGHPQARGAGRGAGGAEASHHARRPAQALHLQRLQHQHALRAAQQGLVRDVMYFCTRGPREPARAGGGLLRAGHGRDGPSAHFVPRAPPQVALVVVEQEALERDEENCRACTRRAPSSAPMPASSSTSVEAQPPVQGFLPAAPGPLQRGRCDLVREQSHRQELAGHEWMQMLSKAVKLSKTYTNHCIGAVSIATLNSIARLVTNWARPPRRAATPRFPQRAARHHSHQPPPIPPTTTAPSRPRWGTPISSPETARSGLT